MSKFQRWSIIIIIIPVCHDQNNVLILFHNILPVVTYDKHLKMGGVRIKRTKYCNYEDQNEDTKPNQSDYEKLMVLVTEMAWHCHKTW